MAGSRAVRVDSPQCLGTARVVASSSTATMIRRSARIIAAVACSRSVGHVGRFTTRAHAGQTPPAISPSATDWNAPARERRIWIAMGNVDFYRQGLKRAGWNWMEPPRPSRKDRVSGRVEKRRARRMAGAETQSDAFEFLDWRQFDAEWEAYLVCESGGPCATCRPVPVDISH